MTVATTYEVVGAGLVVAGAGMVVGSTSASDARIRTTLWWWKAADLDVPDASPPTSGQGWPR